MDVMKSKDLLCLSRKNLGLLIRHITGHSFLRYHRSKINPSINPTCRKCVEAKEESHHIIRTCPTLIWQRMLTLCQAKVEYIWNVPGLLSFLLDINMAKLEEDDAIASLNSGSDTD
jgi:hypothetical protein